MDQALSSENILVLVQQFPQEGYNALTEASASVPEIKNAPVQQSTQYEFSAHEQTDTEEQDEWNFVMDSGGATLHADQNKDRDEELALCPSQSHIMTYTFQLGESPFILNSTHGYESPGKTQGLAPRGDPILEDVITVCEKADEETLICHEQLDVEDVKKSESTNHVAVEGRTLNRANVGKNEWRTPLRQSIEERVLSNETDSPLAQWRTRNAGGIYVSGVLTDARPASGGGGGDEGGESAKDGPYATEKTEEKLRPSRFCHICLRRAEKVAAVACSRLQSDRCRKIVCRKCFDEFSWDWRNAIKPGSNWECPHCRQM